MLWNGDSTHCGWNSSRHRSSYEIGCRTEMVENQRKLHSDTLTTSLPPSVSRT